MSDVQSLLPYIEQELNVRSVEFSSDEARCGIKYRATADYATLGRKLRKDIGRVKKALPNLTSDEVKGYLQTGKISVDGIELVEGDLAASRYVELPPASEGGAEYESNTNNDVVVLLDTKLRPELAQEGLAREVINRVQRLRKKAGLVATDDIDVFYRFEQGAGSELERAIRESEDVIVKVLKQAPKPESEWDRNNGKEMVIQEEQEIGEHCLTLTLVRA